MLWTLVGSVHVCSMSCRARRPLIPCPTPSTLPRRRAISSREFWTTNPTIMRQLAQGSEECLANAGLRCPRTNPRFRYSVKLAGGYGWGW